MADKGNWFLGVAVLVLAARTLLPPGPAAAQDAAWPADAGAMSSGHPSQLMLKAPALLAAGKGEEATFWFYAGQLRYRSYLATHPGVDPTGEPAVFSSLFETIGPDINAYAFGDIPKLAGTIDAVLAWDRRHPDPSLAGNAHETVRQGLEGLRKQILAEAETIRKERAARGLPNR
ncbi:hypothetical protein [Mangrovicella endophytica]|uniref:hypothetical protein n=1 Tax=Mangrovicella endophytica TaxID=2066697 RepID=UPI0012FFE3A3|nr:hypothetical protein [Mangrovicella endophytica]